jgi:hypothetical protein
MMRRVRRGLPEEGCARATCSMRALLLQRWCCCCCGGSCAGEAPPAARPGLLACCGVEGEGWQAPAGGLQLGSCSCIRPGQRKSHQRPPARWVPHLARNLRPAPARQRVQQRRLPAARGAQQAQQLAAWRVAAHRLQHLPGGARGGAHHLQQGGRRWARGAGGRRQGLRWGAAIHRTRVMFRQTRPACSSGAAALAMLLSCCSCGL